MAKATIVPAIKIEVTEQPRIDWKNEKKTPVKLKFDVWDDEGNRYIGPVMLGMSEKKQPIYEYNIHELPISFAKALIAEGKAERADPLPGDA